ncbi:uncharacterized protein EKO05_0006121 [Ascochyta rabiei]|uniref:uncharacterized protein n=1 Tax=Didymella rabiei TaxID=5454 RepID=UPI0021FAD2DC|nr:uncharacterized protein EKO05_0006121 [Ascochyta rabiei]UPX15680.1 hypothetical protein EKO05_0006121 [Ascochyta rabiei]
MPRESDSRTSVGNENDWREITDAAERRRAQNRIAQRKYRRNVKLQQRESDHTNESFASRSPVSTQGHPLRPPTAALDSYVSRSSSANSNGSTTTATPAPTSLGSFWDDTIETPLSSESAINADDFEALSLMPSMQEGAMFTRNSHEMNSLAHWINVENDTFSGNASTTRPARSSESPPLNALQKAVLRGQNSIAKLLTENGANLHVVDRNGNNLLHLAVQSGNSASVLFALRNGINVNETNALGLTALHIAIEREDLDTIRLLLGAGADMEMKS